MFGSRNFLFTPAGGSPSGELWTWGGDYQGKLGLNAVTVGGNGPDVSSPTQVGSLATWSKTAMGYATALYLKKDGTLWGTGSNSNGQLGTGSTTNPERASSPVQIGTSVWTDIFLSSSGSSFAIKSDGTLYAWGLNTGGRLGLNDTISRSSPVQVGALTSWSKLATGGAESSTTNGAIKTDGTLWLWGGNSYGQLGQNDTVNRSSPIQVPSSTNWASLAIAQQCTAAIKIDGTLWTWGGSTGAFLGALGQTVKVDRSSPVQVGGLATWSAATSMDYAFLALQTNGTMWSWGHNAVAGNLGLNDIVNRSSPVQVGALTTWAKIGAGGYPGIGAAIKTDGTLWIWGGNVQGGLGLNDTVYRSSPVQLGSYATWLSISIGTGNTIHPGAAAIKR
jgi:alpha-tubulin suppressor-like RCC1 family protein